MSTKLAIAGGCTVAVWGALNQIRAKAAAAKPAEKPSLPAGYCPPSVWEENPNAVKGPFANAPTAGVRQEQALQRGEHPIQLYSMGTPNGVKVTILLEELCDKYPEFDYDAWLIMINGQQFGSEFVSVNPNSKIPAMLHYADGPEAPPTRVFESASILMYLCEQFDVGGSFLPTDGKQRVDCLSWLFWVQGSAPYLGGGFGQ